MNNCVKQRKCMWIAAAVVLLALCVACGSAWGVSVRAYADDTVSEETAEETKNVIENRVVSQSGGNYTVANGKFGEMEAAEPRLLNGDVDPEDYGSDGYKYPEVGDYDGDTPLAPVETGIVDPVSLRLYFGGTSVSEGSTFHRGLFDHYVNSSMPAGTYVLEVIVDAFDYVDESSQTCHSPAFTCAVLFTVSPLELSDEKVTQIYAALQSTQQFVYSWHGDRRRAYDDATAKVIDGLLEDMMDEIWGGKTAPVQPQADDPEVSLPDPEESQWRIERKGVWTEEKYDELYLDAVCLLRLEGSDIYYTEQDLPTDNPGVYTVYCKVGRNNYTPASITEEYAFSVVVVREVSKPTVMPAVYNGEYQRVAIPDSEFYYVESYDGFKSAGDHIIKLTLRDPDFTCWEGEELQDAEYDLIFTIYKAANEWVENPDIVRWVAGKYDPEENVFIGSAKFGDIVYVITDDKGNVVYDEANGINELATLKAATYQMQATVMGNGDYTGLIDSFFITVHKKADLPWWGTLCVTLGALLVVAIVILILWKKGVFRLLTDKIWLAIRTQATVDATIAAVRAQKIAEEARRSLADAEKADKAEVRKQAAAAYRAKPAQEKAAALSAKAKAVADRAEAMRVRAEAMQARAAKMTEQASADATEETASAAPNGEDTTADSQPNSTQTPKNTRRKTK